MFLQSVEPMYLPQPDRPLSLKHARTNHITVPDSVVINPIDPVIWLIASEISHQLTLLQVQITFLTARNFILLRENSK